MDYRAANTTDMNNIPINHRDTVVQGDRCLLVSTMTWYVLGSDGRTWIDESSDGINLNETVITAGSAATSVTATNALPYLVSEGHSVSITVEARFSAARGVKVWNGILTATAKRLVGGSLSITSQSFGVPLELSDSNWNPQFVAVGNSIQLQITGDAVYDVVARGSVTIEDTDMTNDPTSGSWYDLVISDGYGLLLFADTGVTLNATRVTNWADQSGNGKHVTFASGDQPLVGLDGAVPYIDAQTADQVYGTTSYSIPSGAKSVRWTMEKTAAATPSSEILFFAGAGWYLMIHCDGTSPNNVGTKIAFSGGTSPPADLGVCPSGKHDFELYFNGTTVTLYVDGVAGTPVAMADAPSFPLPGVGILGFNGTQWSSNTHLYGMGFQSGTRSTVAAARWIAMSQATWGAHD